MSKKAKKKVKKSKKTSKTTTKDKAAKTSKKGYKRGSLGKAIYAHFDKVGVDDAKYDDCEKIAKATMPGTKFNRYHFSWYKNKYRLMQEE